MISSFPNKMSVIHQLIENSSDIYNYLFSVSNYTKQQQKQNKTKQTNKKKKKKKKKTECKILLFVFYVFFMCVCIIITQDYRHADITKRISKEL